MMMMMMIMTMMTMIMMIVTKMMTKITKADLGPMMIMLIMLSIAMMMMFYTRAPCRGLSLTSPMNKSMSSTLMKYGDCNIDTMTIIGRMIMLV